MTVDWATLRDQLNLTVRPIDEWPAKMTPAWAREKGPFSAALKDTLRILRTELNALNASAIVLQIAIKPQHLRLDGLPRATATAEHPGVILAFKSSKGYLRLWFDRFTLWQSNLRAIAMHLEHLRKATLYGVGEDGQVYRGWTALPPGEGKPAPEASISSPNVPGPVVQAIGVLLGVCGQPVTPDRVRTYATQGADNAIDLIREARKRSHPDSTSGNHDLFLKCQEAAEVLKKHHGL